MRAVSLVLIAGLLPVAGLLPACASTDDGIVRIPGHGPAEMVAYGVHATDWALEEPADACASRCRQVAGSGERYMCMTRCPGFVSAGSSTCEQHAEWGHCETVILAPGHSSRAEESKVLSVVGTVAGIAALSGVAVTCLYLSDGETTCLEWLAKD